MKDSGMTDEEERIASKQQNARGTPPNTMPLPSARLDDPPNESSKDAERTRRRTAIRLETLTGQLPKSDNLASGWWIGVGLIFAIAFWGWVFSKVWSYFAGTS